MCPVTEEPGNPGPPASAPPPEPARPTQPPAVASSGSSAPRHHTRKWLRRLRRAAAATPNDLDYDGPEYTAPRRVSLLERGPFAIGFLGSLGVLTAWGLIGALIELQSILILVVLSFFLALGLNPEVEWLHRRGLKRGVAVLIVALVTLGIIGLALWAVMPVLVDQASILSARAPEYVETLRRNPQIAALDAQYHIIDSLVTYLSTTNLLNLIFGGITAAGKTVASFVFSVVVTVVLTLYFLASLPSMKEFAYELAPASRRPRVRYLADQVFARVGGYVTGLFTIVMIAASVSFVFFNLVGLGTLSLALSTVVALCWFIPLVGSSLAIIIVATVAFSTSPSTGLITLVFLIAYQQFDVYVIQPRVFARSVQVPGVIVVLAAISGGLLAQMPGAILAVPTAAILLLLYQEVLKPHLDAS